MTDKKKKAEDHQEKPIEKQPEVVQRRLVIQTDGVHVGIVESQLSVLEIEAVARRLLEQIGRA